MVLTLTVWQKKRSAYPTRAGEGRLEDPSLEAFGEAIDKLLSTVEPEASPFQIVAQVGDSSRAFQLGLGWTEAHIKEVLWGEYRGLVGVNG